MAIFKNEHTYMEEWLKHHLEQGISHFYLYSNDEKMENYIFLDKYKNNITVIPWINKKNNGSSTIQRQAYTHCIKNYSNSCKYIMMLDLDEFLFGINDKVINIINKLELESDTVQIKSIKIPRFDYGSDGHIKRPSGDVRNNYFTKEKICSSYKTIANTDFLLMTDFYGVHDFPFNDKEGKVYNSYFSYRETGLPNGCKSNINEVPLVIHHYYTKSYEEYMDRCKLWKNGGINTIGYRKNCKEEFEKRAFF